jgi:hypothetical protein
MKAIRTAQEAMLFGGLHCRRGPSGASCSGDTFRIGSRVGQCSKLLARLLAPILIVIVVLGLAVRPYAVACASSSCDRMVNCDQCDAVPGACPQGLACVNAIPQEDTARIAGPSWHKVEWEPGSSLMAGIEVPPERPPPIDD